jgi:predicted secreted hydrolase
LLALGRWVTIRPLFPTPRRGSRTMIHPAIHPFVRSGLLPLLATLASVAGCAPGTSGLTRYQPTPVPETAPQACRQAPHGRVSLPADDGAHADPVEWWYWTGHLKTSDGRWFGFEEVFFHGVHKGVSWRMSHVAVTDIAGAKFHHRAEKGLGKLVAPPGGFDLTMAGIGAVGGGGRDHLRATVDGLEFDLDLESQKAPVLQHGSGYTDYSFGGYTYYYSRERMAVRGMLTVDGAKVPVTGTAWFDHQYGDLSAASKIGWDWFAVQLDDGRDLMLFTVRDPSGTVLLGGSLSGAQCEKTDIPEYKVIPLDTWVSPHTGCSYPSGWRLEAAGLTLDVLPVLKDQEVFKSHPIYWEGAATVSGGATGRAYIELTGYCHKDQP